MRVLHVTEAFGGGITTAILAMVESTSDIEHHLLAQARPEHDVGVDTAVHLASSTELPPGLVAGVRAIRETVRRIRPDVLHAHSSIAGALVRTANPDGVKIVYSPHCFAFERTDVSAARRRAYAAIERALVPRTDVFAAVAPHELDLAAALGHEHLAYVPNRTIAADRPRAQFSLPLRIAAVGRLSAQKDAATFIRLSRYVRTHLDVPTEWTWIGGGERRDEQTLRDAGIDVTGWIPHDRLLGRLSSQQVYVHTAAWEAAPISILEAAALGLPMAVRSIASLDSLEVPGRRRGMQPLADRITELTSATAWSYAQDDSLAFAARHGRSRQHEHLWDLYLAATGTAHLVGDGAASSVSTAVPEAS